MNKTKQNTAVMVSNSVGYVPESYSLGFGKLVPSELFAPTAGGVPVVLSDLKPYTSRSGASGLSVVASGSGHSQVFIALSGGFPGGSGSPSARAFLGAVKEVVASGKSVYLAVAGASGQHFCALSEKPFGGAEPASEAAADDFTGF